MKFQDLRQLRKEHLKIQHDIDLYPYQELISDRILAAILLNFNITKDATPEQVEQLEQQELGFEISRQGGKTFVVGHTVEIIMAFLSEYYHRAIRIGIFAPQVDQAKISYNIARDALRPIKGLTETTEALKAKVREEENMRKLVLPNGSSCIVAPISTSSKIEGLTLDLIIIDEAQEANDAIVKHSIWPMGKTTNAPRIYIGKAGTQICHFYNLSSQGKTYKAYFDKVAQQRRDLYNTTSDARHLIYIKSVQEDIEQYGEDSDEIQREYFGKWQIGTGQFTTIEELNGLTTERKYTQSDKQTECFAGIDTAKHPDSTVVTIIRWNKEKGKKELINWKELRGENYKTQYEVIVDFLSKYNIQGIAIDSTGQGQFMPDWFKSDTQWQDENSGLYEIKFSQASKDGLYRNLKNTIKDSLTTLPNLESNSGRRFIEQMINLQQQYKGQYLCVAHPDDPKAHDDYPDSWALAEWAFARWNENNNAAIAVVDTSEKERKVKRDDSGQITDYWPGVDWLP